MSSKAARMAFWYGLTTAAVAASGVVAIYATVHWMINRKISREFPAAAADLHMQLDKLADEPVRIDRYRVMEMADHLGIDLR